MQALWQSGWNVEMLLKYSGGISMEQMVMFEECLLSSSGMKPWKSSFAYGINHLLMDFNLRNVVWNNDPLEDMFTVYLASELRDSEVWVF